jgi:hypothetical protein
MLRAARFGRRALVVASSIGAVGVAGYAADEANGYGLRSLGF